MSQTLGIGGDNVRSMEHDVEGRLWLLTNYGLARLQTDGQRKSNLCLYTVDDGLPRNYYGNSLSCALSDGTLRIAAASDVTLSDITALHPENHLATLAKHPPAVFLHIRFCQVGNGAVPLSLRGGG